MSPRPSRSPFVRPRAALAPLTLASLAVLSACGDGGAAGDVDDPFDPFARSPIEDFVGVWNISGHGNPSIGDTAFMVIGPVDEDGEAPVRIQEFDERDLCYDRETGFGHLELGFNDQVFSKQVTLFDDAVFTLSGGMLDILYFDSDDVNGNGDADEQITFTAPRATRADITPLC